MYSYTWFKIHPEFLFWNFIERNISYYYTAFSDPLENFIMALQRAGHFLECALRTDRGRTFSYIAFYGPTRNSILEPQMADHSLYYILRSALGLLY